ncbi:signal peptidase I [Micrococcus luteus]|uniref:signal peptidase I n=1 Tax=Micrococcus luteus TaxID=1270 RepID=UPI002004AF44|nr:signal peptidase I [Micrococcus luteus]MCK6056504.1 signal peptidase I [Micrococcus luteus]MCK6061085.1 signal peptidase I [Micrococcus luteus]MCK6063022.1 signal peptidase I [Micrococcus luteus]MCK6191406.1 signal peptidase I [Micrococcus luteus]MCK6193984.1 signal peptidase I [Micrococcus luteus]
MRTSEPRDPRRSRGSVASGAGSSSGPTATPASGASRWWARLGLTVVAAVVVAAVLRALTGPVYLIPSGSMEPTLQPGDRVQVEAAAVGGQGLHHGDVVVFDGAGSLAPYGSAGSLERGLEDIARWWGVGAAEDVFVKRVLALPGDRLECCAPDGRLLRNGEPLDEPYLGRPVTADDPAAAGTWSFEVPDGRMVVLGDHRDASRDSRALLGAPGGGLIPLERVEGRAAEIVWPLARRGTVDAPSGDTP